MAQAIEAQTATGFAIRDMVARALADSEKSDRRSESRLADVQLAQDQFAVRLEDVLRALQTLVGPIVDARHALEEGRRTFDRAVEDSSARFVVTRVEPNGDAPRHLQIFALWVTNLGWKHRLRITAAVIAAATPWMAKWPEIWAGIKLLLAGGP